MRSVLIALTAGLALAGAASAQPAAHADPRIRVLPYDADRVTPLDAVFGYQMMVQFAAGERIQNVAIGDGSAWQITPNKTASLLFVKPLEHAARTNMTVVTDRRSYLFDLEAQAPSKGGDGMTYVVRFAYPPEPPAAAPPVTVAAAPAAPQRRNARYTYTGSRQSLPSVVFDDGRFTYFKWPDAASIPALFLLAPDGSESLANYGFRDGFQVVEQTAPRFKLRNGKNVTVVINQGWSEPEAGPEAPRPDDAKTAREAERGDTRAAETRAKGDS